MKNNPFDIPGFAVNHNGVQADKSLEDAHADRQLCFLSHRNQQDPVQGPAPMQPCRQYSDK